MKAVVEVGKLKFEGRNRKYESRGRKLEMLSMESDEMNQLLLPTTSHVRP